MEERTTKSNGVMIPSWLVKALALAFITCAITWATYLQAQADNGKTKDTEQDVKIEKIDTSYQENLTWIRASLTRIEAEVKENK